MFVRHYLALFIALVVFAGGVIFFRLGSVPHGMTWDEAAIGYNGYAVVTTRRDEWLNKLPVSFRSFGDYKAPLAIYVSGFFTLLLGSSLWVLRLPFAIAGVMSVVGIVLLIEAVLGIDKKERKAAPWIGQAGLWGGAILVTTPWFLHFARTGFESGMALAMLIWGTWAAVKLGMSYGMQPGLRPMEQIFLGAVCLLGCIGSLYAYHSAKMVLPFLAVVLLIRFWKSWLQQPVMSLSLGLGAAVLSWLVVRDTLFGSGGERFQQASILTKGLPIAELLQKIYQHMAAHLSPEFWLFGGTPTLRHGDGSWGVLLAPSLLLLLCGVTLGWRKAKSAWFFGIVWLVAGLLPAATGVDVPHSNRALLALPGVVILVVLGAQCIWHILSSLPIESRALGSHGEKKLVSKAVIATFIAWYALLFVSYQHDYYTTFAKVSADDYKDGYLEAFRISHEYERGVREPVPSKILFTSDYGQPYIYALYVRRTNPIWYQGGSLNVYEFNEKIDIGDLERENTLVVASNTDNVPRDRADQVIYGSDGLARFYIFAPRQKENNE